MSLKGVNHISPQMTAKFLDAVEDLQKGKKGAAERLYKFVENGRISIKDYEELIEQYGKPTSHKKKAEKETWYLWGVPLTKETLYTAIYIIAFIISGCIFIDSIIIINNSIWFGCSATFLILSTFLYIHFKNDTIQDKDREIADLKQEVRKLEDIRKSDEHIIELLEKELERYQDTSQQN